ncbi:MAG: hypothetical protein PHX61_07190 [Alphaproteobacteria bacterium]|nr:hypothetical protein [Alphaproteobacteria bacterium]
MTWFGVSVIVSLRLRRGKQVEVPVFENIILIEARTPKEAARKAARKAEAESKIDDGLTLNGKPAHYVFEGVRKVVNISNPVSLDLDKDRPVSGTEITYSEFVVSSTDIKKLVTGKELEILYIG